MSTQFVIYEDESATLQLDERSCKFDLDIILNNVTDFNGNPFFATLLHKADESQIIDIAVNILGPLFDYNPGLDILEEFAKRLKKKGYI